MLGVRRGLSPLSEINTPRTMCKAIVAVAIAAIAVAAIIGCSSLGGGSRKANIATVIQTAYDMVSPKLSVCKLHTCTVVLVELHFDQIKQANIAVIRLTWDEITHKLVFVRCFQVVDFDVIDASSRISVWI